MRIRDLTKEEKEELLAINPETLTLQKFDDYFSKTLVDGKVVQPRFSPGDYVVLEKDEYHNAERIKTNAGLIMVHKYVFDYAGITPHTGYMNFELNSGGLGEVNEYVVDLYSEGAIDSEQIAKFIDRISSVGFGFNTQCCASLTLKSVKPIPEVIKRREELLKKNREAIDKMDLATIATIQDELVELAKECKKNDSDMELYTSGARGAFNNAYKNAMIMRGPIFNSATGEWECVEKGFMEIAQKKDIPVLANSVIAGSYPKAVGTAECGHLSKRLVSAFQTVVLDAEGSDCKSAKLEEVLITKGNMKLYKYRISVEGGKYVTLNRKNLQARVGKVLKLRSAHYCCSKKVCSVCAGSLYYIQNIKNAGITTQRVSNAMLNFKMKMFHDSNVKSHNINLDQLLL